MSTARPSWEGEIKFGLLAIPVQLFNACPDEDSPFVKVHGADGGRLKTLPQVCSVCVKSVATSEVAKGVDIGADQVAIVTDAELALLATESRKLLKLDQFPPAESIRPAYYDKVYYVRPPENVDADKTGYDLLRRVLETTKRVGIGKLAFRAGRERIAAIGVDDGALVAYILRFPADLRVMADVPRGVVSLADLKKAEQLVDATNRHAGIYTSDVPKLTAYEDLYSLRLASLIKSKRQMAAKRAEPADVSKALDTSLTRAERGTRKRPAAKATPATADVPATARKRGKAAAQ